jgi:glycogen debranching enzyme
VGLKDLRHEISWLETESVRMIRQARRKMKNGMPAFPPQVGSGYEAFWLRDFAYTLEGSVDAYSEKELMDALKLFMRGLEKAGTGVDCIKFDGTPVYKPGYGTMGLHPVADGTPFTVDVVWLTWRKTGNKKILKKYLSPLVSAMQRVPRHPDSRLVFIKPGPVRDRCGYGFTDTVNKQGDVLFSSLLFVQACRQLTDLLNAAGNNKAARYWEEETAAVEEQIRQVFWDDQTGLFRAATVRCREPDIWGSAFAVYLGVADMKQSLRIGQYFKDHFDEIVYHGQIRHIPGGVFWEDASCTPGMYQNGAYWAVPAGWFVYALDLADPELSTQVVVDLVADFKEGGVCEWVNETKRQLPGYLASIAAPLPGFRRLNKRCVR